VSDLPATHPFTVHDLWNVRRVGEIALSPDGAHLVTTVRALDPDGQKLTADLWWTDTAGGPPRRLTTHPAGSHSARFAPDGRSVLFLSARSGKSQVWRIAVDGGEAEPVTDLPLDVAGFALSPDGASLVVALEVYPDAATLDETVTRLAAHGAKKASGQIFDQLMIRHWDTWYDGRRSHLFVLPIAGGAPVDLTPGLEADTPPRPFGGMEEVAFTPDGAGLVFCAHDRGRERAWTTDIRLFHATAAAPSERHDVSEGLGAVCMAPRFSPDGKTLAWLAMTRPGNEADRLRVVLRAFPDGEPRALAEAWDRSAGLVAWSPDGKTVLTAADNLGQRSLFGIDVASGAVRTLVRDGWVGEVVPGPERIFFTRDDLESPPEVYSIRYDGSDLVQHTTFNAAPLADVRLGAPEPFTFAGWNGETVHGYVVTPADFDPTERYPVAFIIHGGPQGSMGNHFHFRWNPQVYAGAGYASVFIDFHGSTGYGQAFTDAIRGHWGDRPLEDLQRGLEAALARFPWLDGERVAALGASYGGYMVNWIAGNWPDRFRCLVNHDGILCERAGYYDTEELWFPEWEHGGPPWEQAESYERFNPVRFVDRWQTPMLVIHGGQDFRVVDVQGIGTFTALQRRGIPSRLLYFPDENHWVLKPSNAVLWHETVLAWLDQWCRGEG